MTGLAPARFTLAVGTTERFGTPVENVPNRGDGSAGVQRWYTTPPTSTTAPATTAPSTTAPAATNAPSTTDPATTATPPTTPEPDPSPHDSGSNVFAIVLGALVVMAAGLTWLLWQRRGRDADGVPT